MHRILVATAAALVLSISQAMAAEPTVADRVHAVETGLRPAAQLHGAAPARWTLQQRMAELHVPAVSVAVIRDGKLAWAKAWGVKQVGNPEPVDTDSVFSVGSVSKVAAAAMSLRLVDAGKLDLDRDVNEMLRRWKVPANEFTAVRPVTLRGILSHTAGFSVSGFPDFQPGQALPTVFDTLDGKPPAVTGPVRVVQMPGAAALYSGGGITVEQLLIEDATGQSFVDASRDLLFKPLDMARSTFVNPLPESHGNVAKAHDAKGQPTALPRGWEAMPEMAASGLWTTPSDYARLMIALMRAYRSMPGAYLRPATAHAMMTEVGNTRFGLGPILEGHGATRRFWHSGANDSYKALVQGNLGTGDGVVIFTNSTSGNRITREVLRAVAEAEGWTTDIAVDVPDAAVTPDELQALAGVYEVVPARGTAELRHHFFLTAAAYRVAVENGVLQLTELGGIGEHATLLPEGPTQFISTSDSARRIEFVRGYDGAIHGLIHHDGGVTIEAVRRKAP